MKPKKKAAGRPKHVAEYHTGINAKLNFGAAMKAILSPKKKPKKAA